MSYASREDIWRATVVGRGNGEVERTAEDIAMAANLADWMKPGAGDAATAVARLLRDFASDWVDLRVQEEAIRAHADDEFYEQYAVDPSVVELDPPEYGRLEGAGWEWLDEPHGRWNQRGRKWKAGTGRDWLFSPLPGENKRTPRALRGAYEATELFWEEATKLKFSPKFEYLDKQIATAAAAALFLGVVQAMDSTFNETRCESFVRGMKSRRRWGSAKS